MENYRKAQYKKSNHKSKILKNKSKDSDDNFLITFDPHLSKA